MATEGGHWYKRDGSPCYTIEGKNGVERPTTLRDARKLDLVPSVTSIIPPSYELINWKIDQGILSALTLPRGEGENDESFFARIKEDAQEQAKKAAERGTQIHAIIESGFQEACLLGPDELPYYVSARATLDRECGEQDWWVERSFATPRYGGKVDLHCDEYLIDIKTKNRDISKEPIWDSYLLQLAAYDSGLGGGRRCGILFMHTITAESRVVWVDEDDLKRGLRAFNGLVDYWYAIKKFGEEQNAAK